MKTIDIVFDGPPGPVAGRFVEVEDLSGASISVGEWLEREDGYWVLRIPGDDALSCEELGYHICGPAPELFRGTRDALRGLTTDPRRQ
jgi:hypothetical protein